MFRSMRALRISLFLTSGLFSSSQLQAFNLGDWIKHINIGGFSDFTGNVQEESQMHAVMARKNDAELKELKESYTEEKFQQKQKEIHETHVRVQQKKESNEALRSTVQQAHDKLRDRHQDLVKAEKITKESLASFHQDVQKLGAQIQAIQSGKAPLESIKSTSVTPDTKKPDAPPGKVQLETSNAKPAETTVKTQSAAPQGKTEKPADGQKDKPASKPEVKAEKPRQVEPKPRQSPSKQDSSEKKEAPSSKSPTPTSAAPKVATPAPTSIPIPPPTLPPATTVVEAVTPPITSYPTAQPIPTPPITQLNIPQIKTALNVPPPPAPPPLKP